MPLRATFAVAALAAAPLTALAPGSTTHAAPPVVAASAPAATAALPYCNRAKAIPVGNGWVVQVPAVRSRTGGLYENCSMRYGDREGAVRWLQLALNKCYGLRLAQDGVYGAATRSAVRRVQQIHRITADGVYGPQTMKAMKWRFTRNGTESEQCYRPLVNRTIVPAPAPGPHSPYCETNPARYAGNGWWVLLPGVMTRTGNPSFACYLREGDRSTAVYQLQYTLQYCYKSRLTRDGVYGSQTEAAVRAVQRLHGITADGIYGPATMRAMFWRLTGHTPPPANSVRCYSPF